MNFIKIKIFFIYIIFVLLLNGCSNNTKNETRRIIGDENRYIGDSVFLNNELKSVVYKDSLIFIDSVVYTRYDNGIIKSIENFKNGDNVFENIEYFSNGMPKTYMFIDEDKSNYFYRLDYDSLGKIIKKSGELFFQGFLDKINSETLEVIDDGEMMHIQIYYPNPPNCGTFLYVNLDTVKEDVFQQSKYFPFMKEVWAETNKHEKDWTLIDIWLEEYCGDDTVFFNKPIYYKVKNEKHDETL